MKVIQKPTNARGTRDFGPKEMAIRSYVFSTIKRHFEAFGFQLIETPAMENLSVLTGKYGEEGDQLLFKIINSGDYLSKVNGDPMTLGSKALLPQISEKGLRYDLTVPFARFVAMNRNDLAFPFRRSQIQPVWRADRPQKGRYREFYQCDADIIGSDSLVNEAELIALFQAIFKSLNLRTNLIINSRKILAGIVDKLGATDLFVAFAVAIDKLDKIGWDAVALELGSNGFQTNQIEALQKLFNFEGTNLDKIELLKVFFADNALGNEGLSEIESVLRLSDLNGYDNANLIFDFKLARGLSYYTGLIYEGKSIDVPFGSIVGGGRYDNLVKLLSGGKVNLPALGFFGLGAFTAGAGFGVAGVCWCGGLSRRGLVGTRRGASVGGAGRIGLAIRQQIAGLRRSARCARLLPGARVGGPLDVSDSRVYLVANQTDAPGLHSLMHSHRRATAMPRVLGLGHKINFGHAFIRSIN